MNARFHQDPTRQAALRAVAAFAASPITTTTKKG